MQISSLCVMLVYNVSLYFERKIRMFLYEILMSINTYEGAVLVGFWLEAPASMAVGYLQKADIKIVQLNLFELAMGFFSFIS